MEPASSREVVAQDAGTVVSARRPRDVPVAAGGDRSAPERRRAAIEFALLVLAGTVVFAPILRYMVRHWQTVPDYSHGFLIVPLAAYFAWERRGPLRRAPIRGSWWGVVPLVLGLAALTIGRLGTELTSMRSAYVLLLIGLVVLVLGWRAFRIVAFPLLFLFLMVPLPQSLVNIVAFPLQLQAADWAVQLLYYLHVPALREGNIIHLPQTPLFVAEACSGLRSLMALLTLGIVFAYFFRKSLLERLLIVLSTIPLAILVNAGRVALTGILTYRFGPTAAEGVIHETQGLFTFGAAFLLLLGEAWLLDKLWPRRWRRDRPVRRSGP